jgi:hypothetical protein
MDQSIEQKGVEHLRHIEKELEEIKDRTPTSSRAFLNGILQGGGAIVGSIAALILLGWLLSVFGVIPGFSDIAQYLQNVINQVHR